MRYAESGANSKSFINALAKAKRESKKVDYDAIQTEDISIIVSQEYHLTESERKELLKRLEKYVNKMNDIFSLSWDEFVKYVEG